MGAPIGGGAGGLGGIGGGSSSAESEESSLLGGAADSAGDANPTSILTKIKTSLVEFKDWAAENGTVIGNKPGPEGKALVTATGKVAGKSTWYSIRSDPWDQIEMHGLRIGN